MSRLRDACAALIARWRGYEISKDDPFHAYNMLANDLEQVLNETLPLGTVCMDCGKEWKMGHECQNSSTHTVNRPRHDCPACFGNPHRYDPGRVCPECGYSVPQ